ncbi:MAG: sigma-54-dependent Fis family transcriptional regulator, partial [Spirochaetales bacterium]|nr:sigma-54-dependent Fis family transcriptional regulator [Spirochaetales bacterium]
MKLSVCIVDDEKNVRLFLKDLLEQEGYEITEAADCAQALKVVEIQKPRIVILDLNLPDGNGIDLIEPMKARSPLSQIIVITALGTVDNAVRSMKLGAFDFITKPFEVESILLSIARAGEYARVSSENAALRIQQKNRIYFEEFIGQSPVIERIKNLILKLVHADVPILITGETGTGKNVLAKQIHFSLSDPDAPVVYTNCSSIPDTLFESELFGHEKGAFTGAQSAKRGRVEEADGGTLILDEISEIPYEVQAKLLDFLQERTFYRIGGTKPYRVNIRIVAISNRNLEEEIEQGRFRKDLFYRLNLIHFHIPPLRDRKEDIPLLVDHFLSVLKRKYGMERKNLS